VSEDGGGTAAAVMVNRLAQGLVPTADGVEWFVARDEDENRALLRELVVWAGQAGWRPDDVAAAVAEAGIKPTCTPVVLVSKGRVGAVPQLPRDEHLKAFRLLVALLAVADRRRRVRDCSDRCTHWWHHLGDVAENPS
jgi:hypothetical protein